MIPSKIVAGDSLSFSIDPFMYQDGRNISFPDWTLALSIRGNGAKLDVNADSNWKFAVSASTTASLPAGKSFYQLYASKSLERITVNSGSIEIGANLFAQSNGNSDNRSQIQIDLESVQATIRAIISGGAVREYRIGTRLLARMAIEELLVLESKLKYELFKEQKADRIRNGLGDPHKTVVRFLR